MPAKPKRAPKPTKAKAKPTNASPKAAKAKRPTQAFKPRKTMAKTSPSGSDAGAPSVDTWLRDLGGWRAHALAQVRDLLEEADPDIVEEVKWRKPSNGMMGVPVWSHDGLLCTGEPYKDKVKVTFAYGASLRDPTKLFNAADTGATRRAIDIRQDQNLDAEAFKSLVRAAVARNIGAA